jgi:ATP-binding cassette subfamily C (CFTR/MRP) protein 1
MTWWSEDRFHLSTHAYIGIYVGWALAQMALVFCAALSLSYTIIKTANAMHDKAFRRVLNSPLSFFDTTPVGRIINR